MAKNKGERNGPSGFPEMGAPVLTEFLEVAEKVAGAILPETVAEVIPELIALDTFLKLKFGKLFDQAGGFAHYAKKQGLLRTTRAIWEEAHKTFSNRKVG